MANALLAAEHHGFISRRFLFSDLDVHPIAGQVERRRDIHGIIWLGLFSIDVVACSIDHLYGSKPRPELHSRSIGFISGRLVPNRLHAFNHPTDGVGWRVVLLRKSRLPEISQDSSFLDSFGVTSPHGSPAICGLLLFWCLNNS